MSEFPPRNGGGAGFTGTVISARYCMFLGSGLLTNVLGQEGIGWLRFSGDTWQQGEPQIHKMLAS